MSMFVYDLSGNNELKTFGTGRVILDVFIDGHCHSICSPDIENCGYAILKFFNYNGLLYLVNDFNVLKESFLNKVKSPYFSSVLDRRGILSMNLGTYRGGYLALDIEEGEIPGKLHISFNNWSSCEIDNAFKEAEDYITRFKIQRLLLCEKLVAETKEVCQQEGFPFKDPFEPKKKEKTKERKQESTGFFKWLFNLFKQKEKVMKTTYECGKCGKQFDSAKDCKKHEENCEHTPYYMLVLEFYVMKDPGESWDPDLTIYNKEGKAPDWESIKEDHEDAYDYDDDYLRSVTLTAYAKNKDDIKPAYERLTKAFKEYQQSYMKSLASTFSTDLKAVTEKDPMEELDEEV